MVLEQHPCASAASDKKAVTGLQETGHGNSVDLLAGRQRELLMAQRMRGLPERGKSGLSRETECLSADVKSFLLRQN
jgi:hypothetical protein